ncbi:CAP domain-containing protein [Streptomyces sp. SAJ15]|uniref:CAP domain-containing protein n=1 Tax=Streptomyces sp. SAJ15 TaxID=2011095 RepID=UPI0011859155|nr:CAP domain-containing protein [Streptomyces sp. SAJ15]TVL87864.1 stress protein [Streptomyces sp. SAJ15]
MTELVSGGNMPLPEDGVSLRVPGPFDLSLLITGEDGRVAGDADFVFFNQPSAPGARLQGDTLTVHPLRLRAGASRVTVVVSPAAPGTPLGRLPAPALSVTTARGARIGRFTPPRPNHETVLLLAEIYRRGAGWKLRALGQGYADGLAGLARDFGVDVEDDGTAPTTPPPRGPVPPAAGLGAARTAAPPPVPGAAPSPWPRPGAPVADAFGAADDFAGLVNAARARAGAPPVTPDGRLAAAARAHAEAMAAQRALAGEGRDGVSLHQRITASGYRVLTIAEHLVSGPRTPAEFLDYCLADRERGAAAHDPAVVHTGLGRATAADGNVYWTALWAAPFTPAGLARLTAEVVALTNAERAAARLAPLAADPLLAVAAQAHSDDMVARDFYSHTTPEGREPWDRAAAAGCPHRGIGENIACGQRGAAEVVRGWMDSPGHRANILKPDFTHIGVGYATGSRAGTYWTQLFGAR